MDGTIIVILSFVALFVIIYFISRIKIVPQAEIYIVERVGSYHTSWQNGIHFLVPFIDKISKKVSIKEQVVDFKPQPVITKDNVTMQIDTVVFFQVTDAKLFTYGVDRPIFAIENLSATTLRNIIGDLMLDATLTSRDLINTRITAILDEATDRWGIKVNRVELKNIIPPREIQDSMEREMKAERERREKILQAEGDKNSKILVAEGERQSKILQAQGEKESEILKAEAMKQAKILQAQGEAESILLVQNATADGIAKLNAANPQQNVLTIKSLETFEKVADGKATKIIIPSEIQGIAGLAAGIKGIISE